MSLIITIHAERVLNFEFAVAPHQPFLMFRPIQAVIGQFTRSEFDKQLYAHAWIKKLAQIFSLLCLCWCSVDLCCLSRSATWQCFACLLVRGRVRVRCSSWILWLFSQMSSAYLLRNIVTMQMNVHIMVCFVFSS